LDLLVPFSVPLLAASDNFRQAVVPRVGGYVKLHE
jgi:hypothetical protein